LAAQLVLTASFVVAIIISTSRFGLQNLKCSSLATLCVLDAEIRRGLGPVGDVSSQSRMAACVTVKLQRGESLMLVRCSEGKR
jgi:hypothetical protein